MRVLLVEDDRELVLAAAEGLRAAGFAVDVAERLNESDRKVSVNTYDCVVADRSLPDGEALDQLKKWRRAGFAVPVLMLTALGTVEDRVSGFEHGADDYLNKPNTQAELAARVRALCRRAQPPALPELTGG